MEVPSSANQFGHQLGRRLLSEKGARTAMMSRDEEEVDIADIAMDMQRSLIDCL
jgi:hypothetical protein